MTVIKNSAFYGCTNLSSFIFPNNITTIEDGAFNFCTSLSSAVIPSSVSTIGADAFANCSSLSSDNGTSIEESELPVQLTISSQTGISDITAKANAYLFNSRLYVDSPVAEKVEVYSEAGTLLFNFKKPAGSVSYPVESAKGSVLVVKGSSGWVRKVVR